MNPKSLKILIIQTAHIGDVVLALPVLQRLKSTYPNARIDFLLRNGNQNLLENHPDVDAVYRFDRKRKLNSIYNLLQRIRKENFDLCINLQRYFSSGFIASFSGAKEIIGFKKNPLSTLYSRSFSHKIEAKGKLHEVERNLSLLEGIAETHLERPKLYPSSEDKKAVSSYTSEAYFVIAPASVWHTKQLPEDKWVELIDSLPSDVKVFLIGASTDISLAERIQAKTKQPSKTKNLCGNLSFLQSTALIANAKRTFTNDSAALHFASAVNAPITSFFLSTVPAFGFSPLSEDAEIVEVENLDCKPCGLHGHKTCPEGHFSCATEIKLPLFE